MYPILYVESFFSVTSYTYAVSDSARRSQSVAKLQNSCMSGTNWDITKVDSENF